MNKIFSVAKYTFLEILRSRVMFAVLLMGLVVFVISYVASEFAYGAPMKVSLDFGIGLLSMSNLGLGLFFGASLLAKEIESKTLYMVLSRPVKRYQFLIGKALGLSAIVLINTALMGIITFIIFKIYGGAWSSLMMMTLLFSFFEAMIVMVIAIIFSLITSIQLSVILTMFIYFSSHALEETSKLSFVKSNEIIMVIIKTAKFFLPYLEILNLKDYLIYQQSLSVQHYSMSTLYFIVYFSALVIVANAIFNKKNLD